MPDFALTLADDPLGLADATGGIQLTDAQSATIKDFSESLGDNAQWLDSAVVELRPREEGSCSYELISGNLAAVFGAAVNTDYIITGFSAQYSATGRPTATINWLKPSNINKLRAVGGITETVAGGFGVVNSFGATAGGEFISSSVSIELQTADAGLNTSQDYIEAGLFYYGYKRSVSVSAYGEITAPVGARITSEDDAGTVGRDAWKTYNMEFWQYLNAI